MSDLPEPLVPADVDLRDFAFMPVDVKRLLTSETWMLATGEQRGICMTLWLESWHQVPAGSLPDNDRMLAHLAQVDAKVWKRARTYCMTGWIKCSDGRLYHPVVTEKALDGWAHKEAQRARGRKGNEVRWGSRKDGETVPSGIAKGSPKDRTRIAVGSRKDRETILEGSSKDRKGEGEGEEERTPNGVPKKVARAPRSPPARSGFPEGWQPKPSHLEKCRRLGFDPANLAEAFEHDHRAKGSTFADWDQAFFTWIGREEKYRPPPRNGDKPPKPLPPNSLQAGDHF